MKNLFYKQGVFGLPILVIYYWLVYNFFEIKSLNSNELFLFIQFPIGLFSFWYLLRYNKKLIDQKTVLLIWFLILVILINIARQQIPLILSTVIDILPALLLLTIPFKVTNRQIRSLFYLQIVIGFIQYLIGMNEYGILPFSGSIAGREWKVSLFALMTPPFTAAFAFIVFLVNNENQRAQRGKIFSFDITNILSLYFVIFAGSRTIYLILGFYLFFLFISSSIKPSSNKTFYVLLPILVFFIALFGVELLKSNVGQDSVLYGMLFREEQGGADFENSDRYIMWADYLNIFKDNIFFGRGYFDPQQLLFDSVGSSETLLPLMLAYHGLVYGIFLMGIFKLMIRALKQNNDLAYLVIILFLVLCSFYGSFMRGYSLLFILIFLVYNSLNTIKNEK